MQEIGDPRYEEVCYGMIKTHLNCYKVPSPKTGTQSLLGPNYIPGIKINLRRVAGDPTAKIPASDFTRELIGNVEPATAHSLSPLLDSNIRLRTECRIPSQLKRQGQEPGQPTSAAYAFDIVLYGPMKYVKQIGIHLKRHGQQLVAPHMVQKGIRVQNPHVSEYRPPLPKSYSAGNLSAPVSVATRTVEEVKSEVMGVFDSLTKSDDLPERTPGTTITTPLLKHQRQGLYFMMAREKSREEQAGEQALTSFWQQKHGLTGQLLYFNVITGHNQKMPPPETRGGILADMMGLGKTLSVL